MADSGAATALHTGPEKRQTRTLKDALLSQAESALREWFPNGKVRGHEFMVGSVAGEAGESLKVDLRKGVFCDFATGQKGGDLLSLYEQSRHLTWQQAYDELAPNYGISDGPEVPVRAIAATPAPRKPAPPPKAAPIIPVPQEHWGGYPKRGTAQYRYLNKDGILTHVICRHDGEDGKWFEPWHYSEKGWTVGAIPKPWPLYNALHWHPEAGREAKRIYVVEGEKCADALANIATLNRVVTWQSGAVNWKNADWSLLKSAAEVAIWPDYDAPGLAAAQGIAETLHGLGVKAVKILDFGPHLELLPPEAREGADCVDFINAVPEAGFKPLVANVIENSNPWSPAEIKPAARPRERDPAVVGMAVSAALGRGPALPAARPIVAEPANILSAEVPDGGNVEIEPKIGELLSVDNVSDDVLAAVITAIHAAELLHLASRNAWYRWDGARYLRDERRTVYNLARRLLRAVARHLEGRVTTERGQKALRERLGSNQTIQAALHLASSSPVHAVATSDLDADPWILNTPAGIVELRSGETRPHDPATRCTKITGASPGGQREQFDKFLERVQPDPEVRRYLQRVAGYALVGLVREHVLIFFFGTGRNGKSVFANALAYAMGEYAITIGAELLMESHNDRHPAEIAVLCGARLAIGSEIDTGRRWNEARVKRLTGGDKISARYMHRDPFDFHPSHTLLVLANTKPSLRSVDQAIRSRLHLVPWTVTIDEHEQDPQLPEKLQAEAGGILAWAIEGCLEWQRIGLAPPAAILEACNDYFDSEDGIASWIAECCEKSGVITLQAAHRSYSTWCETNSQPALGRNTFADQLERRGFRKSKDTRNRTPQFNGLSLPIVTDRRYGD